MTWIKAARHAGGYVFSMMIEPKSPCAGRPFTVRVRDAAAAALRNGTAETCEIEPGDLGTTVAEQALAIDRLLLGVARDSLSIEVEAPKWKLAGWELHDGYLARLPGKVRASATARGGWLSLRFSPLERATTDSSNDNAGSKSYRALAAEMRALAETTDKPTKRAKLLGLTQQLERLADLSEGSGQSSGAVQKSR